MVEKDNSLAFVGFVENRFNYGVSRSFSLPWVVFTDSNYNVVGNHSFYKYPVKEEYFPPEPIFPMVYPNPFTTEILIDDEELSNIKSIQVINSSGQTVYSSSLIDGSILLDHVEEGVYIVILTMLDGSIKYRKLVKQ